MNENIEETASFLQNLTLNDKLIAITYLDFSIYFYFFISLALFITVFFLKKPPFDNVLIKRILLLIISIIGSLLFFKMYFYIFLLIISTIGLSLWKVRDEIKQYFLIKNYNKKDLDINLSEDISTKITMEENDEELYNKIGLIQFFNQLFGIFIGIKNIIFAKNEMFGIYLRIIFIFSFISILIFFFLFLNLFETKYIFISQ